MDWPFIINLGSDDPREIAGRLITIFLSFVGIIVVFIVIWAGFKYMTSGGKEEKVTDAKKTLANLLIGLVIMFSAYGIVRFVMSALSEAGGVPDEEVLPE